MKPPSGWLREEGEAGVNRSVVVWHPADKLTTSVSVLCSYAGPDFVSIGSLGTAYEFAFTMVNSQDRSGRKKNKQIATLIDSQSRGGNYFVEYTIQKPDEGVYRHLYEQVALKGDRTYNRLWTVTGIWADGDTEGEAAVRTMVDSWKLLY